MSRFTEFSPKQATLLSWWCGSSPLKNKRGIICDGAVRSGKTICMAISFVMWSMSAFNEQSFAICGKTVGGVRRNVIVPLTQVLTELGFICEEKVSKGYIDISLGRQNNRYYLFSGKDEASASLIQGITLAGILLDEVALMPRSFVEQAVARCSVENAKLWFNCNPENPSHWFYKNWIKKAKEKKMAYLHFTMEDNPSLSDEVKARYHSLYSGAFHERFVLGKWAAAQGAVYPMFSPEKHIVDTIPACERYYLSCDYGTVNPTSIGLWGEHSGKWYRIKEYYHASRVTGILKTDEEYYIALEQLAEGFKISSIVVDPSAASFIECIRRHGRFNVIPAKNQVVTGIRTVGDMLKAGKILFHCSCAATINEFYLYCWDENAGQDVPIKENDHAMDEMRYLIMTIAMAENNDSFFAMTTERT